jgi:hypothetical protein
MGWRLLEEMGMNKTTINIVIGLAVGGILLYLAEENTTLVWIALGGLAYLFFSNGLLKLGTA